ncbi:MAG: GTPase, partial [Cyanobacteria bacterium J06648_11]
MRRPYVLLAAIAILICLVLLLSAVGSLAQLYGAIAAISPLLAQITLALIVLAFLGALIIILRYGFLFLRPKRKRTITLPTAPDEVAAVSLQATQQQVSQIKDEIARQALAAKSQALSQRIAQQTFQIVVFGLGSTGKTALVNALVGEMAGDVAATIGTTQGEKTYRVVVDRVRANAYGDAMRTTPLSPHSVLITDTPGLLEAGVLGEARAQEAQALAAKADLLLFV